VVVGEGAASLEKLAKAHACIERGARLLATNPDNWCPVSPEATRPGAGATAAFLEASTGRRAYFLGKPNGYMFHRACRRLADIPPALIRSSATRWRPISAGRQSVSTHTWCSPARPRQRR
jgi:ribonucleotide monophosphatase NagD (HAD superfamily)